MINPITGKRVYFIAYVLVWIILFFVQTSIEFFAFGTSITFAFADSLIYNLLFLILGITMWFPVRYMSLSEKSMLPSLLNHVLLGIVMLLIWNYSGYVILRYLFHGDGSALKFLETGMTYRLIVGALLFILLITIYYLIVYSENLKQKINDEANLKTLIREAELNALKSQINPHFLFNSLNSISSLTIRDPGKARKMIIELSEFLRYSLKHKEKEQTSLEEEIENIARYLEIERIRFEGKLIFKMVIPEECKKLRLPNMILQPLFENAIKHGVYESLDPVTINMTCECNSAFLLITIVNNYDPDFSGGKGNGIGLKNIAGRLRLIYGMEGLLSASGQNGEFKITLSIPSIT